MLALLVAAPLRAGWEEHLQCLTLSTSLRTRYELGLKDQMMIEAGAGCEPNKWYLRGEERLQ